MNKYNDVEVTAEVRDGKLVIEVNSQDSPSTDTCNKEEM